MTKSEGLLPIVTGVLSREALRARIVGVEHPLVRDVVDLDTQLQPNGIDLTLKSVARHAGAGTIGTDNSDRVLPELEELTFDADGWVYLPQGSYHIVYNEIVDIPNDLMALGRPRSSLGRSGATIHTSVWDAGYEGRSTSLLSVLNPSGFTVRKDARVMQLVFMGLAAGTNEGYSGTYLLENM